MSDEVHASNEALSHLWQSQAVSRQARASEVIVGEAYYQPPTPIEFQAPKPLVERPEPLQIEHGPAFVIDHLPAPATIATTRDAKSSSRSVTASTRAESTSDDRTRATRSTERAMSQRRTDERRVGGERERHDHATRLRVSRHEETSRNVRADNFNVVTPPPTPRPVEPIAPAKTPTWDVRRPSPTRPVDEPAATRREMNSPHAHRSKSKLAHSLLGGLDQRTEDKRVGGDGSVDVVA